MKLSEIMREYRKVNKLSTRTFADKAGCTNAYISLLENDKIKSPSIDVINNIANAMGIDLHTLLEKMDNMNVSLKQEDTAIYEKLNIDYIRIPLYSPLCCGNGGFVDDNIIEQIPVPSKNLSSSNEYFCQLADGESMKDAGINDGDLLVFEMTPKISVGIIGCFCTDENIATCKKYKEQNGIIMLQPMNSEFEPIIVDTLNESFRCLGVLKKVIKDFQ